MYLPPTCDQAHRVQLGQTNQFRGVRTWTLASSIFRSISPGARVIQVRGIFCFMDRLDTIIKTTGSHIPPPPWSCILSQILDFHVGTCLYWDLITISLVVGFNPVKTWMMQEPKQHLKQSQKDQRSCDGWHPFLPRKSLEMRLSGKSFISSQPPPSFLQCFLNTVRLFLMFPEWFI